MLSDVLPVDALRNKLSDISIWAQKGDKGTVNFASFTSLSFFSLLDSTNSCSPSRRKSG
jgi:hypothetical protein